MCLLTGPIVNEIYLMLTLEEEQAVLNRFK